MGRISRHPYQMKINMTHSDHEALRAVATRDGATIAEVIRRGIRHEIAAANSVLALGRK